MFKNFPSEQTELLLNFYNKIWSSCQIPTDWLESHIIPILKPKKNPLDPASYRPISLTSVLCKVLEKIIVKR